MEFDALKNDIESLIGNMVGEVKDEASKGKSDQEGSKKSDRNKASLKSSNKSNKISSKKSKWY